jgi:hypothetical protein
MKALGMSYLALKLLPGVPVHLVPKIPAQILRCSQIRPAPPEEQG